jgi:DNA-binding GntR family transcriptional regulator
LPGIPLHEQIAAELRKQISDGVLKPGDQLPSESELEAQYGASRGTVRKALISLADLTENGQGRPRTVRRNRLIDHYASRAETRKHAADRVAAGTGDAFITELAEQGHVGAQSIRVSVEVPPGEIAKLLGLEEGETAVVRDRVRFVDGEPNDLNRTWYPHYIADGTAIMSPYDVVQGTIALMRELGYDQVRHVDWLTARQPTPDEARMLGLPGSNSGVALLGQVTTGYLEDGTAVKVTETLWRGDRTRLIYELTG